MRARLTIGDLLAPLEWVGRVILPTAVPLELTMLHIQAAEALVTLTASDGQMRLAVDVRADVEEPGELLVNGRRFIDFVSDVPNAGECRLTTTQGSWLATRVGRHSAKLHYTAADLYPEPPTIDVQVGNVEPHDLARALRRTTFAAERSRNDQFNVVHISIAPDEITLTATDRSRAAMDVADIQGCTSSRSFILPLRSAELAMRILGAAETAMTVGTSRSANHFSISSESLRFSALAINQDRFPDLRPSARHETDALVTLPTDDLLGELRALSALADETSHAVNLSVLSSGLRLSVTTPDVAQDRVTIAGQVSGSRISTRVNARYLAEAAEASDATSLRLRLPADHHSPIVIACDNDDDPYRCVISSVSPTST